tara:strand:+ start:105 stop:503 length:399 start_codon:yes stop_codon:yes gene_type:complete
MTKKRTMNELRQEKTYGYKAPEKDLLYTRPAVPKGSAYVGDIASDEGKKYLDIAGDDFMLKQAKDQIVNELQDRFYDVIFQAVNDEMSKNYLFRQNNYLTEAGEELFEDAWFEWYHEQHGDILYRVLQKLEP